MAFQRMMDKANLNLPFDIAENINNAANYLKQKKYQLVVCDLNLPDGTAFDLSSFFISNRFVLISGFVDSELEENAKNAGIDKVFLKKSELTHYSEIINIIKEREFENKIVKKDSPKTIKNLQFDPSLSHLKKTFDNNSAYISDIIYSYLDENPKLISRLKLATEINDTKQIIKTAHQLKSGYIILGFKELEHLSAIIETGFPCESHILNTQIQSLIEGSKESYNLLNSALQNLNNSL